MDGLYCINLFQEKNIWKNKKEGDIKMKRKKPAQLNSLAFDVYIYSNGTAGIVISRNTGQFRQFNNFQKERQTIVDFMEQQRKFYF